LDSIPPKYLDGVLVYPPGSQDLGTIDEFVYSGEIPDVPAEEAHHMLHETYHRKQWIEIHYANW
jgi:hypothetical protein